MYQRLLLAIFLLLMNSICVAEPLFGFGKQTKDNTVAKNPNRVQPPVVMSAEEFKNTVSTLSKKNQAELDRDVNQKPPPQPPPQQLTPPKPSSNATMPSSPPSPPILSAPSPVIQERPTTILPPSPPPNPSISNSPTETQPNQGDPYSGFGAGNTTNTNTNNNSNNTNSGGWNIKY